MPSQSVIEVKDTKNILQACQSTLSHPWKDYNNCMPRVCSLESQVWKSPCKLCWARCHLICQQPCAGTIIWLFWEQWPFFVVRRSDAAERALAFAASGTSLLLLAKPAFIIPYQFQSPRIQVSPVRSTPTPTPMTVQNSYKLSCYEHQHSMPNFQRAFAALKPLFMSLIWAHSERSSLKWRCSKLVLWPMAISRSSAIGSKIGIPVCQVRAHPPQGNGRQVMQWVRWEL